MKNDIAANVLSGNGFKAIRIKEMVMEWKVRLISYYSKCTKFSRKRGNDRDLKWHLCSKGKMLKRLEKGIEMASNKSQLGHERIQKIIHVSLFSNVLYMVNKRNSLFNNYGLTWSRWCGWRRYSLPVCPIQIRQPSNLIFAIYIYPHAHKRNEKIHSIMREKWEKERKEIIFLL